MQLCPDKFTFFRDWNVGSFCPYWSWQLDSLPIGIWSLLIFPNVLNRGSIILDKKGAKNRGKAKIWDLFRVNSRTVTAINRISRVHLSHARYSIMTLMRNVDYLGAERNRIDTEFGTILSPRSSSFGLYFPKEWIVDSNSPDWKTLFNTLMWRQLLRVRVNEEEN